MSKSQSGNVRSSIVLQASSYAVMDSQQPVDWSDFQTLEGLSLNWQPIEQLNELNHEFSSVYIYLSGSLEERASQLGQAVNQLSQHDSAISNLHLVVDAQGVDASEIIDNRYWLFLSKSLGVSAESLIEKQQSDDFFTEVSLQASPELSALFLWQLQKGRPNPVLPNEIVSDAAVQQARTNNLFDLGLLQSDGAAYVKWTNKEIALLTGHLLSIQHELSKDEAQLDAAKLLLKDFPSFYQALTSLYFSSDDFSDQSLYRELSAQLQSFFSQLSHFINGYPNSEIAKSDFIYSSLYQSIHQKASVLNEVALDAVSQTDTIESSTSASEEKGLVPLFAKWMRAGQQNFSSAGSWLKTIGRDAIGRLGQEMSNSMSVIQVFGFIQTKHYYELTGPLTAEEKLDLQLQMAQLIELIDMPITWTIDSVRYFMSSTKMMTVRFLSSVSDVISKAFFVWGAFFGIAVDAYSIYVSAKMLSFTNDKRMQEGIIFGLVMSVLGFVMSLVMATVIVGFVVTSVVASVATAATLATGIASGVAAGISSAMAMVGPIGLAVALVMMMVSGLYGAITTVKRYEEKINMSASQKLHLGVRSFFMSIIPIQDNFATADIENEYQRVITKEQYAQMYLDYRENFFTRLIESLAYGSEKLYRVVFTIDGLELEVASTYKRGLDGGYETYKAKSGVARHTTVDLNAFNFETLVRNANKKNVRDYQPDFPIGKMAYSVDGNKGLYALKFEGWRSVTAAPYNATVTAPSKTNPYSQTGNGHRFPTLMGDFNGDEQSDIVRFMDRGVHINFNNGGFFIQWEQLFRGFSTYRGYYENQSKHPRLVGDFNGDGYDDIIGFQDHHVEVLINRRLTSYPADQANHHLGFGGLNVMKFPLPNAESGAFLSSTEPGKIAKSYFTRATGFNSLESEPRIIGDFNCDRRDDIVGSAGSDFTLALSTSELNSFTPAFSLSDQSRFDQFKGIDWSTSTLLAGDFNGDGCQDLAGLTQGKLVMTTGTSLGATAIEGGYTGEDLSTLREGAYLNKVVDITNDNYDDILFIKEDGSFNALVSKGDGTFSVMKSEADWFTYPQRVTTLSTEPGNEDKDWLYFNIKTKTADYIGRDHDNAVYVHYSNGQIYRHILGPDAINGEDGIIAIELGDGNDEAKGVRDRSNHFYIGEGSKVFKGGEVDDKFILNTMKNPETVSILDGGIEAIENAFFRQPPVFEPIDSLTPHNANKNQHDYFTANVPFINPDDVKADKVTGFEIDLHQTKGYVKHKGADKEIAKLMNIEHATGHAYTGDLIKGDKGFNVLDGLGSIFLEKPDVLEGGEGDDLLILHNNTNAYGGEGDDRYIVKTTDNSSMVTIKDGEGNNSVMMSVDLEQIAALGPSEEPDDLVFYIDHGEVDSSGKPIMTYMILEGLLADADAVNHLSFITRDGFTFKLDGEKGRSKNFYYNFNLTYDASKDITYAADFAKNMGRIRVIQDVHYQKIQVLEMNEDLSKVERVIRDIRVPGYATLKAKASDFHDEIHGTLEHDIFTAGKGNDYMVGRGGEDYYVVTALDKPELAGVTRINNFDLSQGDQIASDILRVNLYQADILLVKDKDDLVIRDQSVRDLKQKDIIVEKFFVSKQYQHLFLNDINDVTYEILINSENEPYLAPGIIQGTDVSDHKPDEDGYVKKLIGSSQSRTTLFGLDGDDLLQARSAGEDAEGANFFDPNNKGDILLGGNGSDILVDSAGMDLLKGEEGNDLIVSSIGDDVIDPGGGIDHVFFMPGARGLKTFMVPADLEGSLQRQRSKKIMVPYDIEEAIFQRVGDDLQMIFMADYSALSSYDTTPEEFTKATEKALIVHVKDYYTSIYFRRFRLAYYDVNSLDNVEGIDRNLPSSVETLKQRDGVDILDSYREKSQLNQSAKSAAVELESALEAPKVVEAKQPSMNQTHQLLVQTASTLQSAELEMPELVANQSTTPLQQIVMPR